VKAPFLSYHLSTADSSIPSADRRIRTTIDLRVDLKSHLSQRETDDDPVTFSLLVSPGDPIRASTESDLVCGPQFDFRARNLQSGLAHLRRSVFRRETLKKAIHVSCVGIRPKSGSRAPKELRKGNNIHNVDSVKERLLQFNGVDASC
jgi:hypothetical protein